MLEINTLFWVITFATFASVALLIFVTATYFVQRGAVRHRLQRSSTTVARGSDEPPGSRLVEGLTTQLESTFGLDEATRSHQRVQLLRSGYFGRNAVLGYNVFRLACVIIFPAAVYFALSEFSSDLAPLTKFAVVSGCLLTGYYLPEAYLKRRERLLQERFKLEFPDLLDLLVVCVDAGLSLEAALERVGSEIGTRRALGVNLAIMSGEMRAGRGTVEALNNLAQRLGIEDARSMALLLQQSLELGTDISQALRTYSDEMREKRMSRAEERANALPVKIVLPLGAFIFPVILIMILVPVMIRLTRVLGQI